MKTIDEIDSNFRLSADIPADTVFCDPREEPFRCYGLAANAEGSFCRLPLEMLPRCSEGVRRLAFHTAGACVRFSTDSPYLAVLWELGESENMAHFTPCGQSGMELFEETEHGTISVGNFLPQMQPEGGCLLRQSALTPLGADMRHYVLYLPLYNSISSLMLGFAPDAHLEIGRVPSSEVPLVFYGSSITQGGCAAKTGSCYTTLLARRLDAAQINLGFSGNAKGEEIMARYISGLKMSAFILDYDHNAPSVDHLLRTHEPFFRIVREAQPQLPIVLVSKPDFDSAPEENRLRRNVILRTYANALAIGDRHVYFVDGETFFGRTDRDLCTVDGCHPTSLGFLRMADQMEPVLRRALADRA